MPQNPIRQAQDLSAKMAELDQAESELVQRESEILMRIAQATPILFNELDLPELTIQGERGGRYKILDQRVENNEGPAWGLGRDSGYKDATLLRMALLVRDTGEIGTLRHHVMLTYHPDDVPGGAESYPAYTPLEGSDLSLNPTCDEVCNYDLSSGGAFAGGFNRFEGWDLGKGIDVLGQALNTVQERLAEREAELQARQRQLEARADRYRMLLDENPSQEQTTLPRVRQG